MKIAFFIEEDYSFIFDAVETLFQKLPGQCNICISFPSKLGKKKGVSVYLYYLSLLGISTFIKLAAIGLRDEIKRKSFKKVCSENSVLYLKQNDPNSQSVYDLIKQNDIDVIISYTGYIYKKRIIDAPNFCIINKHAALLPEFRGLFPVFWSMLKNSPIGFTIHKINEGIDTGEILSQKKYDLDLTVYEYYKLIFSDSIDYIVESLSVIENKTESLSTQDARNNTLSNNYFSLPTRKDYREFRRTGHKFI